MWPFSNPPVRPLITLTNTLSGAKEEFRKKDNGPVRMYSCGPTVYGPQHIGNLRSAVFYDTVARTLKIAGYSVKRVVNITDVGHLVGDGDEGEDKMAVGAKRDNTTPEDIAERYTKRYLEDIRALNIDTNDITFPRATAYIKEQIRMIEALEKKGLTYKTPDGVYFNTAKFPEYGELGNVKAMSLKAGVRVSSVGKKNEHDFVLWRTAKQHDLQQWDSPWGKGNPGWSIECSAMATALLTHTIDIHTGGADHIHVHHNNEIAQSEGATGTKPYVRYWLHHAFLTIAGEKISKSLGNTYTLEDVRSRGIHPLALRYLFLQAHYRTPLSFSWDSLEAANTALHRLWRVARNIKKNMSSPVHGTFDEALYDDFKTPAVLETLWSTLTKDDGDVNKKWAALTASEDVLGLSLTHPPEEPKELTVDELPEEVRSLAKEREEARKTKAFARSDELRIHLRERGYAVEDRPSGQVFTAL